MDINNERQGVRSPCRFVGIQLFYFLKGKTGILRDLF